jgi:hypothetical protein
MAFCAVCGASDCSGVRVISSHCVYIAAEIAAKAANAPPQERYVRQRTELAKESAYNVMYQLFINGEAS